MFAFILTGEKKYKCPICGTSFSHVYNRNRHLKRHNKVASNNSDSNRTDSISTNHSSMSIAETNSQILANAIRSNASDSQTQQQFNTANQLNRTNSEQSQMSNVSMNGQATHLVVARKSQPRADSGISAPASNHNKTSTNPLKPYRCHECYKSFTTDDRLFRHSIVHSSDEDVKPLACQFCEKRFLNNSALSCHLKVHRFENSEISLMASFAMLLF